MIDPLSVTTNVIQISAQCIRTARALYDLRTKYKESSMLINAIYTESTVVSTSLGHIHMLISKNSEALRGVFQERPELVATFDQALTGCILVYSVLEEEVTRLYGGLQAEGRTAVVITKFKFLWKEDGMKDILAQIRGQQVGLGLLIQALSMSSLSEIHTLLQANNIALTGLAQRTTKFRQSHPRTRAPSSIFEVPMDDVASIYSYDSRITSTNFSFDDLVINSTAYRRALNQQRSSMLLSPVNEQSEGSTGSDTVVGSARGPSPGSPREFSVEEKWKVPVGVRLKLSQDEVNMLLNKMDQIAQAHPGAEIEAQLKALQAEFKTTREKYTRVKKLYFELKEGNETKEKVITTLQAQIDALEAERTDLEESKQFFQAQVKGLEEEKKRREDFLRDNMATRNKMVETLNSLLKAKEEQRQQLEKINQEDKENIQKWRSANGANVVRISELEAQLQALGDKHRMCTDRMSEYEEHIDQLQSESGAKDEELLRYKSFDSIIEQLRALSPQPPISPSASIHQHNRSPSLETRSPPLPLHNRSSSYEIRPQRTQTPAGGVEVGSPQLPRQEMRPPLPQRAETSGGDVRPPQLPNLEFTSSDT